MRRLAIAISLLALAAAALVAVHMLLIETGPEVVVLRTRADDGSVLESRLWIVDDENGTAWLHGARSAWMHNLGARPEVEVERRGVARRYRAQPVPGPHAHIHDLLRAKYGAVDWWVRTIGPDDEFAMPVRLDPLDVEPAGGALSPQPPQPPSSRPGT